MNTPDKKINWSVLGNEYLITFPNNAQFIELESMKVRLSRDTYDSLNTTVSSQYAKLTIDLLAFTTVCCPKEFKKDLNVESIATLDMLTTKNLIDAYIKQIVPWFTSWKYF
jgi:hypothetical protein